MTRRSIPVTGLFLLLCLFICGCGGGGSHDPFSLEGHWDGQFTIDDTKLNFDMSIDEDSAGNFSGIGRLFWGDLSNGFDSWGSRDGDWVSMTAREDGDDYYVTMTGWVDNVTRTFSGAAEYDDPENGWEGTFLMWK